MLVLEKQVVDQQHHLTRLEQSQSHRYWEVKHQPGFLPLVFYSQTQYIEASIGYHLRRLGHHLWELEWYRLLFFNGCEIIHYVVHCDAVWCKEMARTARHRIRVHIRETNATKRGKPINLTRIDTRSSLQAVWMEARILSQIPNLFWYSNSISLILSCKSLFFFSNSRPPCWFVKVFHSLPRSISSWRFASAIPWFSSSDSVSSSCVI